MRRNIESSTKLRICSKKARENSLAFLRHDGAPNSRFSYCAAQIFPRGGEIFSLPVARWGATFCSFRGIGRGGTAVPLGGFAGTGAPAWPDMRGALPLCTPHEGALRPSTPGDFRFTTKVTKGVSGALPLDPLRGTERKVFHFSLPLPLRQAAPPRKGRVPLRVEGFATLTQ